MRWQAFCLRILSADREPSRFAAPELRADVEPLTGHEHQRLRVAHPGGRRCQRRLCASVIHRSCRLDRDKEQSRGSVYVLGSGDQRTAALLPRRRAPGSIPAFLMTGSLGIQPPVPAYGNRLTR